MQKVGEVQAVTRELVQIRRNLSAGEALEQEELLERFDMNDDDVLVLCDAVRFPRRWPLEPANLLTNAFELVGRRFFSPHARRDVPRPLRDLERDNSDDVVQGHRV